jgi:D-glycero-D-manno-heptose 1,7-bisphosphate phosphatase
VAEPEPAGTAGALLNAADRLDETFFLLNGDSYFDFNWLSLAPRRRADWTMHAALATGIEGSRYGRVQLDNGRVRGFQEKGAEQRADQRRHLPGEAPAARQHQGGSPARSSARSCRASPSAASCWARRRAARSSTSASRPTSSGRRSCCRRSCTGRGVPRPRRHPQPRRRLRAQAEDIVWIEGAIEAVRWLNEQGFYVFVITNQGGVAHGYYEEQHVHDLHDWMQQEMQRHGAHIDAFEHCPFHPEGVVERYRQESEFRKPQPGMILKLQREWTTDPARSFVVGDRDSDVEAAIARASRAYKFEGRKLGNSQSESLRQWTANRRRCLRGFGEAIAE